MSHVAHVLIHTVAKLILAQVFIEEVDMFCVAHAFIQTFAKLILEQVCIE